MYAVRPGAPPFALARIVPAPHFTIRAHRSARTHHGMSSLLAGALVESDAQAPGHPSRRSSRDRRADNAQQGLRRRAPRARPRVRGRPGVAPGAHPSASTRRSAACGAASRGAAQGRWSCRGSASEETRRVRGSKGADATRGGVGRRPPALLARSPATPPTTRSERLARRARSAKF